MWCRVQGGHRRRGADGTEWRPEEGKYWWVDQESLGKGRGRDYVGHAPGQTELEEGALGEVG